MEYKLLIQYFGGRGASSSRKQITGDNNQSGRSGNIERDFASRMNRLADGKKMSFDIMLNNFRESFTTNDEKGKNGKALSSYEHLIAIDDEGFAHSLFHGKSGSVAYDRRDTENMMVIHNHPNDGVFSNADLRNMAEIGQKGVVASGKSGDYIVKVGKNFDADKFLKGLRKSPIKNRYYIDSGESKEQARKRIDRQATKWLKDNQKTYGYTFEYRKAKKLKAKDKIS